MSRELKACSNCNSKHQRFYPSNSRDGYYVQCACGARSHIAETKEKASRIWNNRPIEDALRARIAELEEAQRWIPVSEALPEDGKLLVSGHHAIDKTPCVEEAYCRDGCIFSSLMDITHWKHMPEPEASLKLAKEGSLE